MQLSNQVAADRADTGAELQLMFMSNIRMRGKCHPSDFERC